MGTMGGRAGPGGGIGPCLIKAVGNSGNFEQAEAVFLQTNVSGARGEKWQQALEMALGHRIRNGNHDEEIQIGRYLERRNQSLRQLSQ